MELLQVLCFTTEQRWAALPKPPILIFRTPPTVSWQIKAILRENRIDAKRENVGCSPDNPATVYWLSR